MHCLYCDRPLALLKRLTGDSEFCSKEHRKIYQKEHNQLALARLLESQPNVKGKSRTTPAAAKRREAPTPDRADFITSFPGWATAVSKLQRQTDPLFHATEPALGEIAPSQARGKPRTAGFVTEPGVQNSARGKIRVSAGPLAAPAKIVDELRPKAAQPEIRDENRKLLAAAFLSATLGSAASPVRPAVAGEPRWKPLAAALPGRSSGKIVPVLGALLQRPVRPAEQDELPEIFKIRIRPMVFPRYSPRVGILEERAHQTDRIGITSNV